MAKKNISSLIFCYVTCPDKKVARQIASTLLANKLIACANILDGMESHYVWRKKSCVDQEVILILKSQKKYFSKITKTIQAIHPYECPCIVALPIDLCEKNYRLWINSNLKS